MERFKTGAWLSLVFGSPLSAKFVSNVRANTIHSHEPEAVLAFYL